MNSGSLDWFFQGDAALVPTNWQAMLLGLLLPLACGHVVSWVYMLTHVTLSYSRSFVNALLLLPPNSLIRGTFSRSFDRRIPEQRWNYCAWSLSWRDSGSSQTSPSKTR